MRANSLLEVIDAGHLSKYVEAPFDQRGGLMIVGPPGSLKSTFIKCSLAEYPNCLIMSDLNVQQLIQLRDDLAGGRYSTIGFLEFEKLYQRAKPTAENLEGHIKALVDEGFTRSSFEDQRMMQLHATAFVVGAMTYSFYSNRFSQWNQSGFARRFLWANIRLKNPQLITDAIHQWTLVSFGSLARKTPASRHIPYTVTREESSRILTMLREQPGDATPFITMKKMLCALKWKHGKPAYAMRLLSDFAECLRKNGAAIEV